MRPPSTRTAWLFIAGIFPGIMIGLGLAATLLRKADHAMYKAKAAGKRQVCIA